MRRFLIALLLTLALGAGGAVVWLKVVRPARHRAQLAKFQAADSALRCCDSPQVTDTCRAALLDLARLIHESDDAAEIARTVYGQCRAAGEIDPAAPHAPLQRLCGLTFTDEERKKAALELMVARPDFSMLEAVTCAEHTLPLLEVVEAQFSSLCGADACLDLLFFSAADDAATERLFRFSKAHRAEILAAVQTRVGQALPEKQLAMLLAGGPAPATSTSAALAALASAGGTLAPQGLQMLLASRLEPAAAALLQKVHVAGEKRAAKIAGLLLFALRGESLSPEEEAEHLAVISRATPGGDSCDVVEAFGSRLRLGDPARADAAIETLASCMAWTWKLFDEEKELAASPQVLELLGREIEKVSGKERTSPGKLRLVRERMDLPDPPPGVIRLVGEQDLSSEERHNLLQPALASDDAKIKAAAGAALAAADEEVPRLAAMACAEEQRALVECRARKRSDGSADEAAIAANCPELVACGGPPLEGELRATIAESSLMDVPALGETE